MKDLGLLLLEAASYNLRLAAESGALNAEQTAQLRKQIHDYVDTENLEKANGVPVLTEEVVSAATRAVLGNLGKPYTKTAYAVLSAIWPLVTGDQSQQTELPGQLIATPGTASRLR